MEKKKENLSICYLLFPTGMSVKKVQNVKKFRNLNIEHTLFIMIRVNDYTIKRFTDKECPSISECCCFLLLQGPNLIMNVAYFMSDSVISPMTLQ
jgi:hypothetical protein